MRTMSGQPPLSSYVRAWHPAARTTRDVISLAPAAALAALLDRADSAPGAGEPLPVLWHWLYFLDWPPQAELGVDGHPSHGPFLPPIPARRRMFAGGRLRMHSPIETGLPAVRTSEPVGVAVKEGRTGELLFVTVRHEIRQNGELRLVEEQDLVYRSAEADGGPRHESQPWQAPPSPSLPPSPLPWQMSLTADPVLLFRFSALTANAHRIHYDQHYARDVEHYPALVVHGPLLAVMMAELPRLHAPDRRVTGLTYRFRRPVFAGDPVLVTGDPDGGVARLSVTGASGQVRADAEVSFA